MNLSRLASFRVIYEERSISAAARKLHLAQPALSNQLHALEDELGVTLFDRHARALRPTAAGTALYRRTVQILSLVGTAEQEMTEYRSGEKGVLRMGFVSSSGYAFVKSDVQRFHERYPGMRFEVYDRDTYTLQDMLRTGRIDLAIVRTPFDMTGLKCHFLAEEPMAAVSAGEGPGDEIPLKMLEGESLVLYRRFERIFTQACEAVGFAPDVLCVNDDARTTLTWARSGLGVGILPMGVTRLFPDSRLRVRAIRDRALYTRIALIHSDGTEISRAAQYFIETLVSSGS